MTAMPKPEVKKTDSYHEKNAPAAAIAVRGEILPSSARNLIDTTLARAYGSVGDNFQISLQSLRAALDSIPPPKRHRNMVIGALLSSLVRRSGLGRLLEAPPGSIMLWVARLFFSARKLDSIYQPLIDDYRLEYRIALGESALKAALTRVEYWWRFLKACGLDKVYSLMEFLKTFRDLFF